MKSVAIAGATGFLGSALIASLRTDFHVIGLHRGSGAGSEGEWRACDLFDLESVTRALKGADQAVYLVHSMLPTARLDQSSFQDTDLLLADNFGRAARAAGVRRIIYLGGLIPEGQKLSKHLESRREVERTLGAYGVPVVGLRAGLVLGPEGSSFQIMYLLVKRLPVMLCPRWAWTRTQAVALGDVVELIRFCLVSPSVAAGSYDIGGPDVTTYRELMLESARLMGLKRYLLNVPFFTPGLSTLWVCLVTGASRRLIAPLVKSMSQPMLVRDRVLLEQYGGVLQDSRSALAACLKTARPQLRRDTRGRARATVGDSTVRSIQRLPWRNGESAEWIARQYFGWVGGRFAPLIRVKEPGNGIWEFRLWAGRLLLLKLATVKTGELDRHVLRVQGGVLARASSGEVEKQPVLEFRLLKGTSEAMVALHGFTPRLPWLLYKYTQAVVHLWVTRRFSEYLGKRA
jgi:uncharacterized protein YbjT (DUF2867 family)